MLSLDVFSYISSYCDEETFFKIIMISKTFYNYIVSLNTPIFMRNTIFSINNLALCEFPKRVSKKKKFVYQVFLSFEQDCDENAIVKKVLNSFPNLMTFNYYCQLCSMFCKVSKDFKGIKKNIEEDWNSFRHYPGYKEFVVGKIQGKKKSTKKNFSNIKGRTWICSECLKIVEKNIENTILDQNLTLLMLL